MDCVVRVRVNFDVAMRIFWGRYLGIFHKISSCTVDFTALFYAEFKAVPPKYSVYVAKYVQFAKITQLFVDSESVALFCYFRPLRSSQRHPEFRSVANACARSCKIARGRDCIHRSPCDPERGLHQGDRGTREGESCCQGPEPPWLHA